MGSARYWNQDVDLSLNVQGTLTADVQADFKRVGLDLTRKVKGSRAIAVAHASDLEWVDPVVGARMRHQFASDMGLVLIWVVGRAVFAPGRITFHRIMGAILLYLAIGLTFAALYAFVGVLSTDAFSGMAVKDSPTLSSTMIYFSFGTLTTAGSGDIAALNPFARSLTNVEAMIGQLYPATLLARLVTLEIEGETKRG
jgi:hypothetical protein